MEADIYIHALKRWWWLIILGPIIAAGSAFFYSQSLTPIYRADSTLLVNQTQSPGVIQYNDILTSERLTNTYAELVERQPVLSRVIESLGLSLSERQLADRISVSAVRNTQLLRIEVEDASPEQAALIANTTAQVFIADNANALGNAGTVLVAEAAQAPLDPVKPNIPLNTILAFILGLMVVCGLAVVLEYLDDTVKVSEDTDQVFGLPTLGVVRKLKLKKSESALARMAEEETYAQLRTNVHFARLGGPLKKIVVTGTSAGDGKSTTAAGLAIALAQAGERVILVDTDLRRPSMHRMFRIRNSIGVTGLLLSSTQDPTRVLVESGYENLKILPSGPLPPNPAELLLSPNMERVVEKLSSMASYLIFDTPPVLSVTDASILAGLSDGTILVTVAGKTRRGLVRHALTDLQRTHANLMGMVINKAKRKETGYNYDYYAHVQPRLKRDAAARVEALSQDRGPVSLRPADAPATRRANQG
jgi:capsular exopolysaccharide synthesis family protein